MPGLVPGIHVLLLCRKNVDGRDKPGHDVDGLRSISVLLQLVAADHHVVHFVRAVGEAQVAHVGVHSASGVHCEMPVAPCIWIAWSMIRQTRSGTMALTMLTQTRASWLPSTSIALAAFSTIRRIASISMRALRR